MSVLLRLEGASVGGIGVESERALDSEWNLSSLRLSARGKERTGSAAGASAEFGCTVGGVTGSADGG